MTLKESHELAVIRRAVNALSVSYADLRPGKQGKEPDGVLRCGHELLGIEVTDVYYTVEHAKISWQPARDAQKGALKKVYRTGVIDEFDKRLSLGISGAIRKKETRRYLGVDRLVLLVHLDAPLTEEADLDWIVQSLPPRLHTSQFSEVWIGWDRPNGGCRIWRVCA